VALEERAVVVGAAAEVVVGVVVLVEEAAPNCLWHHSARPIVGVSAALVPVQALAVVAGAEEAVVDLAPLALAVAKPSAPEQPVEKKHWSSNPAAAQRCSRARPSNMRE
jgi:hypothetical protein